MQKKMTKRRKALRRELKGLAFVAPAFIGLLVFTLYPMVNAVINSLYNWNMAAEAPRNLSACTTTASCFAMMKSI